MDYQLIGAMLGTAYWSSGQSSSIEVVGSYTGEDGFMSDEELSWVIYPENYEDSDALYPSVSFTFGSMNFHVIQFQVLVL